MALILNIETALETGSLCLSRDGVALAYAINQDQKSNAAWPHAVIDQMLRENGLSPSNLEAVAVSIGPGSYTGLRVGLSAAKGLCYALKIPLITIGTLELLAHAARQEAEELICPLIDARRMEVFAAMYDRDLKQRMEPQAVVVDNNTFSSVLESSKVLFCGNGATKLESLIDSGNAKFSKTGGTAADMGHLSAVAFIGRTFADLAYTEPLYIKEFYSPSRKIN